MFLQEKLEPEFLTNLEIEFFDKICPPIELPLHLRQYREELFGVKRITNVSELEKGFEEFSIKEKIISIKIYIQSLFPDYKLLFYNHKCFSEKWEVNLTIEIDGFWIETDLSIDFYEGFNQESLVNEILALKVHFARSFEGSKNLVVHCHKIPKINDVSNIF